VNQHPRSNPNLKNPSHTTPLNTVFFPTPFLPPSTFPRFVSQCQHFARLLRSFDTLISANNRSEGSLDSWGMLKLWSCAVLFLKKRKEKKKKRKEKKRKSDSLILFIPPLHSIHLTSPLFVTQPFSTFHRVVSQRQGVGCGV